MLTKYFPELCIAYLPEVQLAPEEIVDPQVQEQPIGQQLEDEHPDHQQLDETSHLIPNANADLFAELDTVDDIAVDSLNLGALDIGGMVDGASFYFKLFS